MYQLGGNYDGGTGTSLWVRSEANHGRTSWTAWRRLLNTASDSYAANMNQDVRTDSGPTFANVYNNGWFRNQNSNTGLYNTALDTHIYGSTTGEWNFATSNNSWIQLNMRPGGFGSAVRGCFYADTGNNVGILNNAGSWGIRLDSARHSYMYGNLTVGLGTNASSIYMTDSDEGTRELHCNSNRIGFLNQSSSWGSWCDDSGNWLTGNGMYAGTFYDYNDNAKYLHRNTSSYTSWYMGGSNNGYSGWRVDGGMCLMIHTNGASGPTGFWLNNWSILTYVDSAQYLYHNGNEKFRTDSGGVVITGTLYATGDVIAYYSDARLKKDVITIDNAINKIKQLRGVTYTWNDEKVNIVKERAGTKDIGLIAQEVEAIEPLLITEYQTQLNTPSNDPDKAKDFTPEMSETYKTIKYEKLVALLVEGMKEQQQQIEDLKNQINYLVDNK
jgi:hypothetical protein